MKQRGGRKGAGKGGKKGGGVPTTATHGEDTQTPIAGVPVANPLLLAQQAQAQAAAALAGPEQAGFGGWNWKEETKAFPGKAKQKAQH